MVRSGETLCGEGQARPCAMGVWRDPVVGVWRDPVQLGGGGAGSR